MLVTAAALSVTLCMGGCVLHAPNPDVYAALTLRPPLPQGQQLRAQFFGTSTVVISDGETHLMVDGFFSRPSALELLATEIKPNADRIEFALARGNIERIDALFVAHSHYDHAMDAPVVATRTHALLFGSRSTANIACGAHFDPSRMRIVEHGDLVRVGSFEIEVFRTPHSPNARFMGTIDEPLRMPAHVSQFKVAENYTFWLRHAYGNVLIVPSANYVPNLLREKKVSADVVFLSIGTLGRQSDEFIRTYWNEVVGAVGARLVIPIHWDDITRPLSDPLQPLPYIVDDFSRSMSSLLLLAQRDGVSIRLMPLFYPVGLGSQANSFAHRRETGK